MFIPFSVDGFAHVHQSIKTFQQSIGDQLQTAELLLGHNVFTKVFLTVFSCNNALTKKYMLTMNLLNLIQYNGHLVVCSGRFHSVVMLILK